MFFKSKVEPSSLFPLVIDSDEINFYVETWERVCNDFPKQCGPRRAVCLLKVAWSPDQSVSDSGEYFLCVKHAPAAVRAIQADDGIVMVREIPFKEIYDCNTCALEYEEFRIQ